MKTTFCKSLSLGVASLAGLASQAFSQDYSFTNSPNLLGDWGGARTQLAEDGVTFDVFHTYDVYDDLDGALDGGNNHFGRLRARMTLDLDKLIGFENAKFVISGVHQYGRNYNRSGFGVFTNPSSIEGAETTRLAEFWLEQTLAEGAFTYRIGKIDAVGAFGNQEYGSSFMNDEFAYVPNAIFGSALPFDPAEKLGLIATWVMHKPSNSSNVYLKGGVFDTNELDAYYDDHNGLRASWEGPVGYAAEIGYKDNGSADSMPSFLKVGMHYNTGDFSTYLGSAKSNDYLVYTSIGRTLKYLDTGKVRHLDASLMWVYSPEDRNLYHHELTAILRMVGPFASRPNDEVGLGFIAAFLSNDYSETQVADANEEYTLELSYKAKVTGWLTLQPSLQYVKNPMGNNDRDDVIITGIRGVINL